MIDRVTAEVIDTHWATPPHTYKQHVAITDDYGGDVIATFCPVPKPECKGQAA
jgi:hypothetical protein